MLAYMAGDHSAFDALFRRYARPLQRVLERGIARDDARDLVQQTFLQLHRHRADFRVDGTLRPWIYTIALNLKRQYLRRGRGRIQVAFEPEVTSGADEEPRTHARLVLEYALGRVPEAERDVIALHWLAGVPLGDVATILGISLSAAKVRAHRGYGRLRKVLEDRVSPGTTPTKGGNRTPGGGI